MQYADSVTKSFLSYGVPNATVAGSLMSTWQDPTYMGFQFRLVQSANGDTDLDDLPHGLFCGQYITPPAPTEGQTANSTEGWKHSNKYSAYNYLINRGEYKRAEYVRLFEQGFENLVKECPWYFVKVSGLADAWKMDPGNNFRGKDKKITIETLESIDMKITFLLDCYRKAVWDANWMRWAVPDHMRYFKMAIIVSEVRPMKIGKGAAAAAINPGQDNANKTPDSKLKALAKKVGAAAQEKAMGAAQNLAGSAGLDIPGLYPKISDKDREYGLPDSGSPWTAATFIKFEFAQCELDVFSEAPAFLESVGIIGDTMATNKIVIKTNVIKETNVYGLLGAILDDTAVWQDYGKDAATNATNVPGFISTASSESIFNPNSLTNDSQRFKNQEAFNSLYGKPRKSLLGQLGAKALAGVTSFVTDAVNSKINGFLLGNVYGTSPLGLLGSAQDILNNPAGAIENILKKHSTPNIGKLLSNKVALTGKEINLVKGLIGSAGLEGVPVAGKFSDTNVGLFAANTPDAILGNEELTSPELSNTTPGKTILSAVPSNQGNPGKTAFDAPNSATAIEGKADLNGVEAAVPQKQSTTFTSFAAAASGSAKANLKAPNKKRATNQNVSFEGATITGGDLGEADMTAPPSENSKLGKADMTAPNVPPGQLGKVKL